MSSAPTIKYISNIYLVLISVPFFYRFNLSSLLTYPPPLLHSLASFIKFSEKMEMNTYREERRYSVPQGPLPPASEDLHAWSIYR